MTPAMAEPEVPTRELHKRHQVSHRFTATLGTNILRMGLSFVTGIMLAQGLGPAGYGDYSFLLATFISLRSFIDLGTSSAFYTFLSQTRRSLRFHLHYALWLGLQAAVVLLVIGLVLPQAGIGRLWVGHSRSWVLLAFLAAFLSTAVWRAAESLAESRRETIWVQRIRLAIASAHFLLVGIGRWQHALNVPLVFVFVISEYAAATCWCLWKFDWDEALDQSATRLTLQADLRAYAVYCKPLVLASLIGFLGEYSSRWLLQFFSGSVQQGFFSIGQQIATVSLLGATSILNIFWKEIAAAHGEGNQSRLRHLFGKSTDTLFFAAAALSCCLIPFSREIILCFLGPEYAAGWPSFAILLLFPVYQTLGQLTGSYVMAAHQTQKYFFFSILTLAMSLPLSYFLVASKHAAVPGLELGALGMALSQVGAVAVSVNVQGWVISRSLGSPWPFLRQLGTMAALLLIGFACRAIASWLIPAATSKAVMLSEMAVGGVLYLGMTLSLAYGLPSLTGIEPAWVREKLGC
jgi:O-antigen/teichoic acid export membrane protein